MQVATAVLLFYGAAHGLNARLAEFAERLREHAVHAWSNLVAATLLRFTHAKHSLVFTAYALVGRRRVERRRGIGALARLHLGRMAGRRHHGLPDPVEIYALIRHVRVGRVILLGLNLVIVAYLVINIRQRHARAARRYGY